MENFGGSLAVRNAQELASKIPNDIPDKYIRPEVEFDKLSMDDSLQIPVIDMSKLVDHDETTKLHLACRDWGIFQLINHGIQEELMDEMKKDAKEFFKLPLEEKLKWAQVPDSIEGYGQAFVHSEDQKLDWGDMLFLLTMPVSQKDMKFWPTNPASFRASFEKYASKVHNVALGLFKLMARNLGVDADDLMNMFEYGTQGIRTNYYPPCLQANKVLGLTPHSDATALTLLSHVNEVQGLQIKKDGKWVPIKPIPGALVVKVGDMIEIMSNGEYKSVEHRVVVNPEKERITVAVFEGPNVKARIGPLPDLVKEKKANYKTVSYMRFVKVNINNKLDGKGRLGEMKLE